MSSAVAMAGTPKGPILQSAVTANSLKCSRSHLIQMRPRFQTWSSTKTCVCFTPRRGDQWGTIITDLSSIFIDLGSNRRHRSLTLISERKLPYRCMMDLIVGASAFSAGRKKSDVNTWSWYILENWQQKLSDDTLADLLQVQCKLKYWYFYYFNHH